MNRMTADRSAAGVADPDHDTPPAPPIDYARTSERAHALGFTLHALDVGGVPAFLVGRWGMA